MARKFKLIIEFVSIKNNNNIYDDQIMYQSDGIFITHSIGNQHEQHFIPELIFEIYNCTILRIRCYQTKSMTQPFRNETKFHEAPYLGSGVTTVARDYSRCWYWVDMGTLEEGYPLP